MRTVLVVMACLFAVAGVVLGPPVRGNVPSAMPLPSPLPTHSPKTLADREAWYKVLHWRADWEDEFQQCAVGKAGGPGLALYPLGDGRWLVEVLVSTAAYQEEVTCYLVVERGKASYAQPLTFPAYSNGDGTWTQVRAIRMLGIPHFDAKRKQWTLFTKFRGPADCGIRTRYAFDRGQPYMVECRAHADCDGKSADPKTWERLPNLK